jgi:hypothetical protein
VYDIIITKKYECIYIYIKCPLKRQKERISSMEAEPREARDLRRDVREMWDSPMFID